MITIYVTIAGNSPRPVGMEDNSTVADVLRREEFAENTVVTIEGNIVSDKKELIKEGQNIFITRENKQGSK